jgi:adenylosuccinate synthase
VLFGPSSVINPEIFLEEMSTLHIDPDRVVIHPRATLILPSHIDKEREEGLLSIGSTNQGVGVARMLKMMRSPRVTFVESDPRFKTMTGDTVTALNQTLMHENMVLCEMTQGFDLCLEHGIHPHYCTSKIITPAMAMAEAGVALKHLGHIYGVLRPYPIRVNNREGYSGPYTDSEELRWSDIQARCGCPHDLTEMTTTTKLKRRVFEFSFSRMRHFERVCGPDFLCLQFANYINWKNYGVTNWTDLSPETIEFVLDLEVFGSTVAYVGTSPEAMIDRHLDEEGSRGNSATQTYEDVSGAGPQGGGEITP